MKKLTAICAITKLEQPYSGLFRFAITPDGHQVVLDLKEVLPKPHVYVTADLKTVRAFLQKEVLCGAFGQDVVRYPTLKDVQSIVKEDVLVRLGLAKRANKLTIGAEEFKKAGGNVKLAVLAQGAGKNATEIAHASKRDVLACFTQAELSARLGIANCTLVGVLSLDIFGEKLHKYKDFIKNEDAE